MYTVPGFDAPAMFPSNGVMTWRPLLSTGSLGMVPPLQRYYGTLRLPVVRLDPFEFFTSRYHRVARGLLPSVVGVQYCSARDLKAIFNFFLFIDLQKGTGDASIVRLRYHRKHLWIVTCYYKIS